MPDADAFLALGRVLFAARLDHFIPHAFTPITTPSAVTRNILTAAAAYHNPTDAEKAESNLNSIRGMLVWMTRDGLWMHMRDELAKFARRAAEELAAREPGQAKGSGDGSRTGPKARRNRAPTPLTNEQREAYELVGRHNGNITKAAEEAGVSRQAMDKRYKKACKKIGEATGQKGKTKTQRLPEDARGQINVARRQSDPDDAE
jgi:predicted DNA-binding protein (UPF0251 family)